MRVARSDDRVCIAVNRVASFAVASWLGSSFGGLARALQPGWAVQRVATISLLLVPACTTPATVAVEQDPVQDRPGPTHDAPCHEPGFVSTRGPQPCACHQGRWRCLSGPSGPFDRPLLDVLFVVDNSRSRPLSQMQLAAAADAFVATLEDPAFAVDYRIGITTTDNGGACSGTTPEGGAFVLQSCRERLDDFVAEDIDVTDAGCRWVCDLDRLETLPTALLGHDGLQSRPWIERVDGHTNLAPGIDPAAAVACALPQGTRGCGYEMPLEAMRKALRRSVVPEEASYGFLVGSDAQLIVFVTDEIDCSMRFEHNDLFYGGDAPSGPSWDSDEPPPTCWDYAARCEGGPGVYDQCWPADIGRDRTPSDPDDAVLVPMSVYHEALATPWSTWPHVYVAGIVGVPRGEAPIVYADPDDPSNELGIGWGCEGEHGNALAPLRLAELAEAFAGDGAPMLESICEPDLEPALGRIATRVAEALEPPCLRWPLADASPDVPGLQPDCLFVEAIETLDQTTFTQLPVCLGDGSMPARADACVHLRDEPRCGAQGYGQAATLRRTPGPAPTAAERTIYFDCVFED